MREERPVLSDEARQQRDEQQQQRREQRAERQRRRQEEKRAQQDAPKPVEVASVDIIEAPEALEDERVQVLPRRKPRQLTQKVRVGDAIEQPLVQAEAPVKQEEVRQVQPLIEAPQVEEQLDDTEGRDSNNMPRRSRRSPRHLRVSGQRRRRYRDERYPTQSAMPLEAAAASPEMASGKVWVRYPVSQANEELATQDTQNEAPDYSRQETAAAVAIPAAVESTEAVAPQQEPVQYAEPQAETPVAIVNTDDTTAIEAPVNEEPSVIPAAAEAKAEVIAEQAKPAAPVIEAPSVQQPDAVSEPATETERSTAFTAPATEQPAEIAEHSAVEVSPRLEAQVEEVLNAPVAADADVSPVSEPHAPVAARDSAPAVPNDGTRWKHFASAPMTKAPAPIWQPEPVRHSDWVRPTYQFDGRGSAGGHSATHQSTAPATKP